MNRVDPRGWWRVGLVVVLVGVGVAGLRARSYAAVAHGVPGDVAEWTSTVLVLALLVVGVVLIVLFVASLRRRGTGPERVPTPVPVSRWARLAVLVILLALLGAPIALLVLRPHRARLTTLGQGVPGGVGHGPGAGQGVPVMAAWPWAVLAGVAIVLLAALAWRRFRTAEPVTEAAATEAEPFAAAVVDAGLDALRRGAGDDPRAAVLACYAAMERALAETGAAPHPADTPLEVVTRAASAHVTSGMATDAAAALAGLFRRARYSTHPFTEADRARADSALERVRHDLEART